MTNKTGYINVNETEEEYIADQKLSNSVPVSE